MEEPPTYTCRKLISLYIDDSEEENNKIYGFHLTRSPWDPYPWISYVEPGSIADKSGLSACAGTVPAQEQFPRMCRNRFCAGVGTVPALEQFLRMRRNRFCPSWNSFCACVGTVPAYLLEQILRRAGDCLLDINNADIVGLRVKEIASLIKREPGETINLQVWRHCAETADEAPEFGVAVSGPLPTLARKLAKAVSGTVKALECPICLETASAPVSQCVHGHILCSNCRQKTPRCPICRIRLGQGRCLVADQIQRNIRDAYEEDISRLIARATANGGAVNSSLREKLFGKTVGKDSAGKKERSTLPAAMKTRLARLLGGFDKAASAENLATEDSKYLSPSASSPAFRRLGELFTGDRTKSASTGELRADLSGSENHKAREPQLSKFYTNSGYLSVPAPSTPCWGGSMDSVINSFPCPLSSKVTCYEPVNCENFIEHLGKNHQVVQVHFFGPKVTIPVPLKFQYETLFIIHCSNDLFFFHYEEETAWVTSVSTKGEWILHGRSSENTEIKLKRRINRIETTKPELADQAPIPQAFNIVVLDIELLISPPEGLDI